MENLRVQPPVQVVEKPSINDWMNEFNVSSRYEIKKIPLGASAFDINRFKKNIDKGLILVEDRLY